MNPPECVRRPLSVAPSCNCPTCRPQRLRAAKQLRVTGLDTFRLSEQAWAALDRMLAAGRTVSEIAATAGVDRRGLSMTLTARRQGKTSAIGLTRARRILAAEASPATGGRVDATVTRRRIRALNILGHSLPGIEAVCGVKATTLRAIRDEVVQVTDAAYAQAVAMAYGRLEYSAGGSAQTRRHAIERGWAPPAAWDDIADLREKPKGVPRNAEERAA